MIEKGIYTLDNSNPLGDMSQSHKEYQKLNEDVAEMVSNWVGWSAKEETCLSSEPHMQPTSIYHDVKNAKFKKLKSTDAMFLVADYSENDDKGSDQQTHVLSAKRPGIYKVSFSKYATVRSLSKIKQDAYSLSLSNIYFPLGEIDLNIFYEGSERIHDFSSTPISYQNITEVSNGAKIKVRFPMSRSIDMKWRKSTPANIQQEEAANNKTATTKTTPEAHEERPVISPVTVRHDALHSVEEGNLFQSIHFLKYSLDSEQASFTETTARIYPKTSRVTSVAAHGLNTWSVRPGASNESFSVLSLSFSGAIADTILVQIGIEVDYGDDTSDKQHISVPKLVCENVIRQTGYYAISKASNIELHQKSLPRGINRIGIKDLSESLRYKASSGAPLVLAYKYLSTSALVKGDKAGSDPELILTVKAHEQMAILDAICENAFYKTTVMDNGRSVHKFLIIVQNTKEQYLRIHNLPSSMKVWSLNVNSVSVKPVLLGDNNSKSPKSLLIPLLVGLPSDAATSSRGPPKTSVEIVYASENDFLTKQTDTTQQTYAYQSRATEDTMVRVMHLTPPLIGSIPVEYLSVMVQFPEGYDTVFSSTSKKQAKNELPKALEKFVSENDIPGTSASIVGPLVRGFTKKLPLPISHRKGKKVVPNDYYFSEHEDGMDESGSGSEGLNIEFEDSGIVHRFQRTLLENEAAVLTVAYQKSPEKKKVIPPPQWWESALAYVKSIIS